MRREEKREKDERKGSQPGLRGPCNARVGSTCAAPMVMADEASGAGQERAMASSRVFQTAALFSGARLFSFSSSSSALCAPSSRVRASLSRLARTLFLSRVPLCFSRFLVRRRPLIEWPARLPATNAPAVRHSLLFPCASLRLFVYSLFIALRDVCRARHQGLSFSRGRLTAERGQSIHLDRFGLRSLGSSLRV